MERLGNRRPTGLSSNALKTWGMFFAALGIIGRSILQNRLLGIGSSSGSELLELIMSSDEAMMIATLAIVMQIMECLATPIFAYLLVEGYKHTSDFKKYLLRIACLALITEIPWDLAMNGTFLEFGSQNPVFGMLLSLVVLYFFNRYAERSFNNTVIKIFIILAAFIWISMLNIENGEAIALIVMVLWAFRNKPTFRSFVGCSAAMCCCVFSTYYLIAPLSFLMLHYYNEEKGSENRVVQYLAYPVILLAVALVGMFLL